MTDEMDESRARATLDGETLQGISASNYPIYHNLVLYGSQNACEVEVVDAARNLCANALVRKFGLSHFSADNLEDMPAPQNESGFSADYRQFTPGVYVHAKKLALANPKTTRLFYEDELNKFLKDQGYFAVAKDILSRKWSPADLGDAELMKGCAYLVARKAAILMRNIEKETEGKPYTSAISRAGLVITRVQHERALEVARAWGHDITDALR